MALFNLFLASLVVLLPLSAAVCGGTCRFRLCRRNADRGLSPMGRRLILNAAPMPLICSADPEDGILSHVNTGRPFIRVDDGSFVTLRSWFLDRGYGDVGGKSITDTSLRVLYLKFDKDKGLSSSFDADQFRALENECLILPVTSYRSIFMDPFRITDPVSLNNPFVDCVSIRTRAPRLHVEWVWAWAGDNFDIEVVEPDGQRVNRLNRKTEHGRLVNDNGQDGCDGRLVYSRESIVYPHVIPSGGPFTINVVNARRCPPGPGKNRFALYSLRVYQDGQIIFQDTGRAIGKRYSESFTFTPESSPEPSPEPSPVPGPI